MALERVQYLSGPAAVLYGDGSPGGLVDLVLKKPFTVPPGRSDRERRRPWLRSVDRRSHGSLSGRQPGLPGTVSLAPASASTTASATTRGVSAFLPMLSFDVGTGVTVHVDGPFYEQRGRGYRHTVPSTPDTQRGDFSHIPWNLNVASPEDQWSGWSASPGVRVDARLGRRSSVHTSARYTRIGGDLTFRRWPGWRLTAIR